MEDYIIHQRAHIAACILQTITAISEISMSWGFENPRPTIEGDPGLQFHTCGYKHTGFVAILYHYETETYSIILRKDDGTLVDTTENILLQDLVSKVDELVEKTEDYEKRISEDYPLLTQLRRDERPISVVIL